MVQAAKADREPEPDVPLIPDLRRAIGARCVSCGRFIARALKEAHIEFCGPACFEAQFAHALPEAMARTG